MTVPAIRITARNDRAPKPRGDYVLYWMTAYRRTSFNFALDRAVEHARDLGRPLLILEALRCDYPWACDRFHEFVLQGMRDKGSLAGYYPYVEPEPGAGKGLLESLAANACVVVTDDYPAFFLPRMVSAAASRIPVRLEAVDSNGIFPMHATDVAFKTAHAFRRHLQRELRPHLACFPLRDPLRGMGGAHLPGAITKRWPAGVPTTVAGLPLNHGIKPGPLLGGPIAGERVLRRFVAGSLDAYAEKRNLPEQEGASGLSPYLHFGHLGPHQILDSVLTRENWTLDSLSPQAKGSRAGWWGLSPSAEAFADQLVTWRELGFNAACHLPGYERYDSLPEWARRTLGEHAGDPRDHLYGLLQFDAAATHDDLWNAAQRQLVREGRIHNYLRMLWGKKILDWSASPEEAARIMVELNNRYATDGRDPNSYSGAYWVLGRYDRAWGPERPVFGKIRYMTSRNTSRKLPVGDYLKRYGE